MEVKRLCHSKVAASNGGVTESSLNKFPVNMNIIWQEFEMYNILGLKVFPLTVAKFLLCTFLNVFFNLGGSQNEVRWRFRPDAFGIQRLKVYNTGN